MGLFDSNNASLQMLIGARQKKKEEKLQEEELAMQKRQNSFNSIMGAVSGAASLAKAGFDVYDTVKLKPEAAIKEFGRQKEMAGITQKNTLETAAKEHEYRSAEAGDQRVWTSDEKKLDRAMSWGQLHYANENQDNRDSTAFFRDLEIMREKGRVDLDYLKAKYGYDDKLQQNQIDAAATENAANRTLAASEGTANRTLQTTLQSGEQAFMSSEAALDRAMQWGQLHYTNEKQDSRDAMSFFRDIAAMREKGIIDLDVLKTKYGYDSQLQQNQQSFQSGENAADRTAAATEGAANRTATISEHALDRTHQMNMQTNEQGFATGESALDRAAAAAEHAANRATSVSEGALDRTQQTTMQTSDQAFKASQAAFDRADEWGKLHYTTEIQDSRDALNFSRDIALMREKGAIDLDYLKENYGYDDALQKSQQSFNKSENALDRTNNIDISKINSAGNVTEINAQARNAKLASLLGTYPSAEKAANQAFMDMFTLWETSNPGKNPSKEDLTTIGLKAAERLGGTASSYKAEFPEIESIVAAAAMMLKGDYTLPASATATKALPPVMGKDQNGDPIDWGTSIQDAAVNGGNLKIPMGPGVTALAPSPAPAPVPTQTPVPAPDAEGWTKGSDGRLFRDEGRQRIYKDALGKPDAQGWYTDSTGKKFKYTKTGKVYK
jgi:hypothetical protein